MNDESEKRAVAEPAAEEETAESVEEPAPAEEEPPAAEEEPAEDEPPAAVEEPAPAETEEPCRPAPGVAAWPFVVYLAAWAALAAATGLLLTGADAAAVPVDDPRYPVLLVIGLTLAACGPVLAIVTWLVAFARAEKGCRGGLLTIALVRGASATLFGVLVWWGALLLVDALRLGLI